MLLAAGLLAAALWQPAEGQQAVGPEPDGQITAILEDMVMQKQRFRPEGLHALGLEGLSAVLDELLPDTAAP